MSDGGPQDERPKDEPEEVRARGDSHDWSGLPHPSGLAPEELERLSETIVKALKVEGHRQANLSKHDAEDLAHDGLAYALDHGIQRFAVMEPERLWSFMRTVVHNKTVDEARAAETRKEGNATYGAAVARSIEGTFGTYRAISDAEDDQTIAQAIDELAPQERRVLVLKVYSDPKLSYKEIGAKVGITEQSAKNVMQRAQRKLETKLGGLQADRRIRELWEMLPQRPRHMPDDPDGEVEYDPRAGAEED